GGWAQDEVPVAQKRDSVILDSIMIRPEQPKIKSIPRSVYLTSPITHLKKLNPAIKVYKKYRPPGFWKKENTLGVNLSEVAFVNWNAGGNNSISTLGNAKFVRNYKFRHFQWDNNLDLRYGLNAQEGRKLQKTDDAIRLTSTVGYRKDTLSNWYYSIKLNFNTQFADGFQDTDRTNLISSFMAPGYLFLGAGTSYIDEDQKFDLYISPVTQKATFVLNQDLADQGAFGVNAAVLDANGNILQQGDKVFMEFGFLITNTWETQLYTNMILQHRISLYTDYLRSFGNIDIDWELILNLTVNEYVNATIGAHMIFDDDIRFDEEIAEDGTIIQPGTPRIQFKQLLGVGLAYRF
ncbi:MAG: DUF3078 domain-containing protein, partial [Bacteroidota bacterium]